MPTIRKVKNPAGKEYWTIRFFSRDKQPNEKAFYFPANRYPKAKVRNMMNDLEYLYKTGQWCPWEQGINKEANPESARPFHVVLDQFKSKRESAYAKTTWEKLTAQINNLKALPESNVSLTGLAEETFAEYVNASESIETRKTRRGAIKTIETWVLQHYPGTKPFTPKIVAPQAERRQKRKTYITSAELDQVIQLIPDRERIVSDVITFAFYTGMRLSEITNMRVSWIQGEYILIGDEAYRPKSDSSEATPVPITDMVQYILDRNARGKRRADRLFRAAGSQDNFGKYLSKRFKSYVKDALPSKQEQLNFHKLRDSAAMYWLHERKLDVYEVRTLLRHSSVTMTERYLHAKPDALLKKVRNAR